MNMAGKKLAEKEITKGKDVPKKVQFEFSAPEAREVFVAGEFNNWDSRATPLEKDKNGMWKLTLPLMPGRYEYRFLTDGNWENDRSCSGCVPNNFGSLNCVRIVE
jgi:1,4-alpha-glucan branching enzyme